MYACPVCGSYETPEPVESFKIYTGWPLSKKKVSPRYFATLQSCPKCKVVTSKPHPDEEEKMLDPKGEGK